jgi:AcrR family transcriptional regulator
MESAKPEKLNKHQAKTEATLRGVLDAAEEIFVRDGYERAQIETIAAQAGRTKGAVYAHFRSKEDIFFALLERKAAERREMFHRLTEDGLGERQTEVLKKLFMDALEEEHWAILTLEFKLFALRNKDSLQRIQDVYRMMYDDIGRKLFPKIGITGRKRREKAKIGVAILRGMPSAIVLERQFNPVLGQWEITRQVFEEVFDLLLNAEDEPGPRRTASRR